MPIILIIFIQSQLSSKCHINTDALKFISRPGSIELQTLMFAYLLDILDVKVTSQNEHVQNMAKSSHSPETWLGLMKMGREK